MNRNAKLALCIAVGTALFGAAVGAWLVTVVFAVLAIAVIREDRPHA